MTKEELLPLAKTYFDSDPMRQSIFGTEDRHFYNTEGDAKYHCKELKKYFQFTRNDFIKVDDVNEDNGNLHDKRKKLLDPLWEFLDENLYDSDFGEIENDEFETLISDLKAKKVERDEELVMAEQIKKEDLLKSRQDLIAPYSEFKSRYKLTINTKEETFNKILEDLKAKKLKAESKK